MINKAYRYRFRADIDLPDAEMTLHLAIMAVEGLYGAARVRMDMAYVVDETICVIVIDGSTKIGQAINSIFTAFVLREFAPGACDVRRVEGVWRCNCRGDGR